jgi:uncharacterized membrane protein YsdA (DUF1294 family)
MKYAIAFYALMSLLAFAMYGLDKRKAKKHRWRTPESLLLGVGLLGGCIGALLGMQLFRHKTKHWYFRAVNLLALLIHAALFYYFFLR